MKKTQISEMTSAGAVAAVPQSMNSSAPIKRESAPAKPSKTKAKKKWRNSLHEASVSEAELSEQDLILTPGIGRKLKPGLMRNQQPHEALEMAMSDLIQCIKNSKRVMYAIKNTESPNIEPWVQEKIVKASDYLNTVCEYVEGQVAMKSSDAEPAVLTFEQQVVAEIGRDTLKNYQQKVSADSMKHPADPSKRKPEKASRSVAGFARAQKRLEKSVTEDKKTEYPEDTWVIVKTDKEGKKHYLTKHTSKSDAKEACDIMREKLKDGEKLSIKKNPDIPDRQKVDEMKTKLSENTLTRGAQLLSALKTAERAASGYTIVNESFSAELDNAEVKTLLNNYRRALQKFNESAVISAFGDTTKLGKMLEQVAYITEEKDEKKAHDLAKAALDKKTKKQKTIPDDLPEKFRKRIERNPHLSDTIVAAWKKQEADNTVSEAKAKNPYAIGMAVAKREAGVKGKHVTKPVIKKAHEIAKAIKKEKK